MSEQLHPGVHPDADTLSALAEGALSEYERFACLAHLAECSRCREIVYLAQSTAAEEFVPEAPVVAPIIGRPIPIRKRWFAPFPAFAAVAAALVLVASLAIYRHNRIVEPSPELTASTRAPAEAPPALETPKQVSTQESTSAKAASRAKPSMKSEPVETASSAVLAKAPPAPPPTLAPQETPGTLAADTSGKAMLAAPPPAPIAAAAPVAPPPALVAPAAVPRPQQSLVARDSAPVGLSGIAGTVTDPAGAVVSRAQVNLVDPATGRAFNSISDVGGRFNIAGLAPGRYELRIDSPGFKRSLKQIDLQPQQLARADLRLEVGASSETVSVTAEASLLKTESGELARNTTAKSLDNLPVLKGGTQSIGALTLPDKLPPRTTVAKDKLMLAADSTGALLLSKDAGKSWKPVKGRWPGKVIRLDTTQDPANTRNTLFRLTTDSASTWLSRNGTDWYLAPVKK